MQGDIVLFLFSPLFLVFSTLLYKDVIHKPSCNHDGKLKRSSAEY
jgi:hypothetical protein